MAELDAQLTQLVEQALSAGTSGRAALAANADYLEFQNEVKRIAGPTASGDPIDWKKMEAMARSLAGLGADLMVYFHLCFATVNTRGYAGLAASLEALKVLIERGWSFCTPIKQRGAYFEIFSRRLALEMKNRPPAGTEAGALAACDSALSAVNEVLGANGARALQEATDFVRAQLSRLAPPPAPAPPPPPPPVVVTRVDAEPTATPVIAGGAPMAVQQESAAPVEVPAPPPAATRPVDVPPASGGSSSSAGTGSPEEAGGNSAEGKSRPVLERELGQVAERLTRLMREEDVASAVPYRLLRAVLWAAAKEPAGDKQDKTRLPAPAPHLLKKVAAPISEGNIKDQLRECEELFRTYPLWLDLQLRTARLLEQAKATEALAAVKVEVAQLLSRLPGLVKLKFASGVPLASEETVSWCSSLAAGRAGVVNGSGSVSPAAMQAVPSAQAAKPEVLPGEGPPRTVTVVYTPVALPQSSDADGPVPDELGAGLLELQVRLMRSGSPRRRFELRIRVIDLCLRHGRLELAGPLADALEQEVNTHHLDDWDPELAAVALRQKLVVERARPLRDGSAEKRAQLWARLCMLNPSEAVALGPET